MSRARTNRTAFLRSAALVFAVAVVVNYVWELAETPLYAGMTRRGEMWRHCFVASLGDGVLVLIILATGWAVFERPRWFRSPGTTEYGLMFAAGAAIAVVVEWIALDVLERWSYANLMPRLPGLGVGLSPVAQMSLLPPLIFRIVTALEAKTILGETK